MVRTAKEEDLKKILEIYETARDDMRKAGNPDQWGFRYPPRELLQEDIRKHQLYVCLDDGGIYGVFAFIIGEDETYRYIEDGAWKNEMPYGTIHRLAGDGRKTGVFAECLDYCRRQIKDLRADTHHDNLKMQYLLEKSGFERCGVIYVANGSARIAYQYGNGREERNCALIT